MRPSRSLLAALTGVLVAVQALMAAATEIETVRSPGGVDAWLVQDDTIPMVALSLHFAGGAGLDPVGKEGLAEMMVALLDEGSGTLDADAYAERREALPMRFSIHAGRSGITLSAAILKRDLDPCLGFLALTLAAPRFDPPAIERIRRQTLSSLQSRETDPDDIAGRSFRAGIFGGHSYGRPVEGTVDSVGSIDAGDLRGAHADAFRRDRVTIAAVGDITPEELGAAVDRLIGQMQADGPPLPLPAELDDTPALERIAFAGSQAVALFGHRGLERKDPDFLAAYVANFIFGGANSKARLGTILRQDRGLTYGVNSYLMADPVGPLLLGSISTAKDRMGEALEVVRAEWRRMAEEGVTATELEAAKRYLIGSYALGFDGNGKIADLLVGLQRAGLSRTYVNERNDRVAALTLQEVNAVAARLFRPEMLRLVVVGAEGEIPAGD